MQNNDPLPTGQQGQVPGQPEDPKLAKQRKKEEAERLKKQQQEKRRQLELTVQLNTFSKSIASSVMDIPTMLKFSANTLKTMFNMDHVAIAMFEEHPEIRSGLLCVCKGESNLPKPPKPPAQPPNPNAPKDKAEAEKKKKEDEDKDIPKPKPIFPVPPKEPPKPGTLPHLENLIWDIPLLYKMKEMKQPAVIPDASKFPDPELNKFAGMFLIKSIIFVPIILPPKEEGAEEIVEGIIALMNVNENKVLPQMELTFVQKLSQVLAKSILIAPPDLPTPIKKVITSISKDEKSDKLIDYYSDIFDDIFDMIVYEIGIDKLPEKFVKLLEEKDKIGSESMLKKIWFQINELVRSEDEQVTGIARKAIEEQYTQADEFTKYKKTSIPTGFKGLRNYVKKNLKYPELKEVKLPEGTLEGIEESIDNALRGKALFTDKAKATLVNDIEQSNMLVNYISAPSVLDFRKHIKSAIEEAGDCPEEVDKKAVLTDLTYYGMAEISKSVCQDLVEKVLFEIPEYLEQPPEKQTELSENLVTHFHRKIMSNLITGIKGKKSVWINYISEDIKQKAKEAAKKRAVLVGRIKGEQEEEEY
ncbi:MAG: hypothetical protein KatS3mg068_0248 [Candidatus Sericytochromatia bacterium]|nr:MAG: hypothetical protein KatS3mg068_0248 [Candidatus Sericytochromatia bacterium]